MQCSSLSLGLFSLTIDDPTGAQARGKTSREASLHIASQRWPLSLPNRKLRKLRLSLQSREAAAGGDACAQLAPLTVLDEIIFLPALIFDFIIAAKLTIVRKLIGTR